MSAANGRLMMAWVWPALVLLARIITAEEPHGDAHGALAGSEALFSDSEPPMETRSGGGFLPVPVWKFVKDAADASDLGRPQFLCSNTSLSVRLGLIRHSDLRLQDGLPSVQQGCGGSVGTVGPWLLLKLPYTSCHVASQVSNGTGFHRLKLRYFDHLLRENMTAVVACEDPPTSTLPEVSCRSADVAVKLPLGSRLQKVKALGKDVVVGRVQTSTTPGPLLVQISTPADQDSMFEVIYLDSAGEMSTMLAACFSAAGGDQRRALQHQEQWDGVVKPHHWHSVEPRQMGDSSSEYLDASDDDQPSDEDVEEELDEYEEESDESDEEQYDDDEELDDTNNPTATMTDSQMNSTTGTVEAEETLNTSMPVRPRLGRGLADLDMSDLEYMEEDEDDYEDYTFLPVGLGRALGNMEMSEDAANATESADEDDEEEEADDDDEEDDDDDEEEDDDEDDDEEEADDDKDDDEDDDDDNDDEDDDDDDKDKEEDADEDDDDDDDDDDEEATDSSTANMTDAHMNATAAASNTMEEMLNTSTPSGPGSGMENMEPSDNTEEPEELTGSEDDSDSADDHDTSSVLHPRLSRTEDMASYDQDYSYDSSGEDEWSNDEVSED